MSLQDIRAKMRVVELGEARGFQLFKPELKRYGKEEQPQFLAAIREQADAIVTIPADKMKDVAIDGTICKGKLRLSQGAFADLCHFIDLPVGWIKRFSTVDECQAVATLNSCVVNFFNPKKMMLVVDSRDDHVDGIVTAENYKPLGNGKALDLVLESNPAAKFTRGWLEGARMRFTFVGDEAMEPVVDQVVRVGASIQNGMAGEAAFIQNDYAEVLKCTNGMTAREAESTVRIIHRGDDLEHRVRMEICKAKGRFKSYSNLMHWAAATTLEAAQIKEVRAFVRDPNNGGGIKLEEGVVTKAVVEAAEEGKPQGNVSLWNFVNAVTWSAHFAPSLQRTVELEAMGVKMLRHFGRVFEFKPENN